MSASSAWPNLARIRGDAMQIVKFHGDIEDHGSIVLDEASYFRRLEFESPLARGPDAGAGGVS